MEHNKNYFLLALALVYGIIASIQIFADGILGTQLYYAVAIISLNTTLLEFLKSSIKWLRALKRWREEIDTKYQNHAKRNIDVLGKCSDSSELVPPHQKLYDEIEHNVKARSKKRRSKLLDSFEPVIQFFEVFLILYVGLTTPLKKIPNDLGTTKIIDVFSLLSVAFAFLSIYMNESTEKTMKECRDMDEIYFRTANYYLDILDKNLDEKSMKKATIAESKEGDMQDDCHRETL